MNQMTCSNSMSSLESPSKFLRTPDGSKKPWNHNRHCNSLNSKKHRQVAESKQWRRSWDLQDEFKQEELWRSCLQSVQDLQPANSHELRLKEFSDQYSSLCEWLNSLQARRGQFMDRIILNELANELIQKQLWRTDINENAKAIIKSCPLLKEEIQWRIKHLNSQWDSLEKILVCRKSVRGNSSLSGKEMDGDGEAVYNLEWLRNWLHEMENELQPLDFRANWTTEQFEEEMGRHKALQAEIEDKSAEVHAVLRGQCQSQGRGGVDVNLKRTARLERRWHQLRLRVLEWLELLSGIEHRARHQRQDKKNETGAHKYESEEDSHEPLSKYRRLGGSATNLQQVPSISLAGTEGGEKVISSAEEDQEGGLEDRTLTEEVAVVEGRGETEASFCGLTSVTTTESFRTSIHVDVENFEDWDMGQSHESESVFDQSGSPVPNSVVEFTFVDGSGSSGIKRKLSSSSGGSQQRVQIQQQQQHVVPKNISTYYFKHSDTEPEVNHCNQRMEETPAEDLELEEKEAAENLIRNGLSDVGIWEKPGLDWGQKTEEGSRVFGGIIGEAGKVDASLGLDVEMEAEEELNSLENLDDIEELVLNAERLVQVNPKGSLDGINVVHQLLDHFPDGDDEEEEEDEEEMKEVGVVRKGGGMNGLAGVDKIPSVLASLTASVFNGNSNNSTHHHQMRKSSMSSNGGKKSKGGMKCAKSFSATPGSMEYSNGKGNSQSGVNTLDCESGLKTATNTPGLKTAVAAAGNTPKSSSTTKNSRVRRWIRAHNKADAQKNASSCDASAESTSESESNSSDSECPLSSDDPTTVSASTFLNQTQVSVQDGQGVRSSQSLSQLKGAASSCSSSVLGVGKLRSPPSSSSGGVIWRSKKRNHHMKQRPKSFTEALGNVGSSEGTLLESSAQNNCCFVSDTALNFIGNQSGNWSSSTASAFCPGSEVAGEKDKRRNKIRRRNLRIKRKSIDEEEQDEGAAGFVRSTSFTECRLDDRVVPEGRLTYSGSEDGGSRCKGGKSWVESTDAIRMNSDTASLNTEDLQGPNDQDWDSYQEKYLSEPYSEELYDPDGTSNLLAFGEDYGKYLDHGDSECSSSLSGFEPNPRKRRPLVLLTNRGEMPESDSDREELNYLLSQSTSQLRIVDGVFKKRLVSSLDNGSNLPSEYMEMEATCLENINSLQLILENVQQTESLPFEVDVKSIQGVVDRWHVLKEKISHAAKLQQIQEEMTFLKKDFDNVQSHLGLVDPFDANNLCSLQEKIATIQGMLASLTERKQKLQNLNEASLGTQLFLKESNAAADVKQQIQELYALYEENFQLGSYLLEKMRFLQDAWEKFESEKNEFEKSIHTNNPKTKLKKELSCAASSDSGHGTDFSHDSSISDSDMDFQERRKKLVALRQRASDLKAFLPPGSPVMDVIDQKIDEAQKGFEELRRRKSVAPLDLKIIYPKKRSLPPARKSAVRKPNRSNPPTSIDCQPEPIPSATKKSSRRWRIIRLTLTFHIALMGLLAAAYFLQPKCCEFSNTFRCSLVPHLTHDSLPTI